MGYTHYWDMPKVLKVTKTQRELIQEVLDDHRLVLAGWNGEGEYEFSKNLLSLNGIGPDDDHETFRVVIGKEEGEDEWHFCKTARKPYDIVVCKLLLVFSLSKGFNFSSDGIERDANNVPYLGDENWPEALEWFIRKGYQATIDKKIIPYLIKD